MSDRPPVPYPPDPVPLHGNLNQTRQFRYYMVKIVKETLNGWEIVSRSSGIQACSSDKAMEYVLDDKYDDLETGVYCIQVLLNNKATVNYTVII